MKTEIEKYIKNWEQKCYSKGIPDEIPNYIDRKTNQPSFKKIVFAILKNDSSLKILGKQPKKSIYYHQLKKIELTENGKIKWIQKELF